MYDGGEMTRLLEFELIENQKVLSVKNVKLDKKIEYPLGGSISILNKFTTIIDFVNRILEIDKIGDEFGEWLWNIIHDYDTAYLNDIKKLKDESKGIENITNEKYNLYLIILIK